MPSKDGKVNVQVAVRVRPPNAAEASLSQIVTTDPSSRTVKIATGPAKKRVTKTFAFDRVFGQYSTQREVFETMALPVVDDALSGYNATIFAYGQTGTGKTFTMQARARARVRVSL